MRTLPALHTCRAPATHLQLQNPLRFLHFPICRRRRHVRGVPHRFGCAVHRSSRSRRQRRRAARGSTRQDGGDISRHVDDGPTLVEQGGSEAVVENRHVIHLLGYRPHLAVHDRHLLALCRDLASHASEARGDRPHDVGNVRGGRDTAHGAAGRRCHCRRARRARGRRRPRGTDRRTTRPRGCAAGCGQMPYRQATTRRWRPARPGSGNAAHDPRCGAAGAWNGASEAHPTTPRRRPRPRHGRSGGSATRRRPSEALLGDW